MQSQKVIGGLSRALSGRAAAAVAALVGISLVFAAMAALVVSFLRGNESGPWRPSATVPEGATSGLEGVDLLLNFPGVTRPDTVPAGEAPWGDDDEVIGVTLGGEARAYLSSSMGRPARHVVNDAFGTTPVSVTYCNINGCARAFTRKGPGGPLDLANGGIFDSRSLLLLSQGVRFHQQTLLPYGEESASAAFPYVEVPVTVTTWGKWREAHPDTRASIPPVFDPKPARPPAESGGEGRAQNGDAAGGNDPRPESGPRGPSGGR